MDAERVEEVAVRQTALANIFVDRSSSGMTLSARECQLIGAALLACAEMTLDLRRPRPTEVVQ